MPTYIPPVSERMKVKPAFVNKAEESEISYLESSTDLRNRQTIVQIKEAGALPTY